MQVTDRAGRGGVTRTQRLESTLIHWTRQIKEIVNQQDSEDTGEESGPLAEIDFWRSRSVDLSGIRAQVRLRRGRFSLTGDLGHRGIRGAVGLGYRFTV
jgi:hypothetical protein